MSVRFQVAIDCENAARMVAFWAAALGYVPEPPPTSFESWDAYWRSIGVPDEEGPKDGESIIDPSGSGPRIWFHVVPEPKVTKNRLHFDLGAGGGRSVPLEDRKRRVEAEAARLVDLGATRLEVLYEEGIDHYAVAMLDPEGNEFDIN